MPAYTRGKKNDSNAAKEEADRDRTILVALDEISFIFLVNPKVIETPK